MAVIEIPRGVIRIPVPDVRQQTDYTCGASSLLSVCRYYRVGPDTEEGIVADMGGIEKGADPEDIEAAARNYGLRYEAFQPMSDQQLKEQIDQHHPVIIMMQAWGDPKNGSRIDYKRRWLDGHWIVAIGWDDKRVYFEDPVLTGKRGHLTYDELALRWHDLGSKNEHVERYGVALWKKQPHPRAHILHTSRKIP